MIKLCFVPEILVFVCEMSLKFDFWGRHACDWTIQTPYQTTLKRHVNTSRETSTHGQSSITQTKTKHAT